MRKTIRIQRIVKFISGEIFTYLQNKVRTEIPECRDHDLKFLLNITRGKRNIEIKTGEKTNSREGENKKVLFVFHVIDVNDSSSSEFEWSLFSSRLSCFPYRKGVLYQIDLSIINVSFKLIYRPEGKKILSMGR